MELIRTKTTINFIDRRVGAFVVSGLLIAVTIAALVVRRGPNLGIDFTGGTLVQMAFAVQPDMDELRAVLAEAGYPAADLQNVLGSSAVIIRIKSAEGMAQEVGDRVGDLLTAKLPDNPGIIDRVEFVGPAVGRHLMQQAAFAVLFSLIGIIVYVAIRFKSGIWGMAGVLALAHDVFITLGLFTLLRLEITLTIIAAFLTLAGYSINDTIVIFDRIRENLRLFRKEPRKDVMNRSINETLSRTIITSVTTLLPLTALLVFGGEVLRDFAIALIFGIIIGTYSTIFIASPVVYVWQRKQTAGKK